METDCSPKQQLKSADTLVNIEKLFNKLNEKRNRLEGLLLRIQESDPEKGCKNEELKLPVTFLEKLNYWYNKIGVVDSAIGESLDELETIF